MDPSPERMNQGPDPLAFFDTLRAFWPVFESENII